MGWRCSKCGLTIPGSVEFPVNCSCGHVDHDSEVSVDPEIMEREAVCETCPNYMGGQRCKKIDAGCRRTYKRRMREGKCPIGRF